MDGVVGGTTVTSFINTSGQRTRYWTLTQLAYLLFITHAEGRRVGGVSAAFVCLFVCLFFHTIF